MNTIKFVKITAKASPGGFEISGYDTFALKEQIKTAGGKWNPAAKTWLMPEAGMEQLKAAAINLSSTRQAEKSAEKAAVKAKKAFDQTPEGRVALQQAERDRIRQLVAIKKETGQYSWICCEDCVVIDWRRQTTYCNTCFKDGHIRVRGGCYTGD